MQPEGYVTMNRKELHRHEVISQVDARKMKQSHAAKQLGISVRQVKRLCRNYREQQALGLTSKKRGKPSNHQFTLDFKQQVLDLARTIYRGFGPTFMAEKLKQLNSLNISKETLRQWLMEAALWKTKRQKSLRVHQRRLPRACKGELIQIDGSPHDWFEGRAEKCCLIVFIDDATSEIIYLRLEPSETTQAYFRGLQHCLEHQGIPAAFYSDRHGIFRVNQAQQQEIGETQFEQACRQLGITLIYAHSPQAKGRVERSNKTHQDRLVKELRLRNISDLDSANAYLETYRKTHNERFARSPMKTESLFSKNHFTKQQLEEVLSIQTKRKITKNLEVNYLNKIYQIQYAGKGRRLQQTQIIICETLDNKIYLLHQTKRLNYQIFNAKEKRNPTINDKELNVYLDKKLKTRKVNKPSAKHPWFHSPISKHSTLTYQRYLEIGSNPPDPKR